MPVRIARDAWKANPLNFRARVVSFVLASHLTGDYAEALDFARRNLIALARRSSMLAGDDPQPVLLHRIGRQYSRSSSLKRESSELASYFTLQIRALRFRGPVWCHTQYAHLPKSRFV